MSGSAEKGIGIVNAPRDFIQPISFGLLFGNDMAHDVKALPPAPVVSEANQAKQITAGLALAAMQKDYGTSDVQNRTFDRLFNV
jgi:hypothetical protein